jgi:hypothetical protein|tara:strand:- start:44 stop:217 length:174 start_codon:yes stop_codon:yes gene_type:complete
MEMDKFEWDKDKTEDQNFRRWAMMNADEREAFELARLTEAEARRLFDELRRSGWLTT